LRNKIKQESVAAKAAWRILSARPGGQSIHSWRFVQSQSGDNVTAQANLMIAGGVMKSVAGEGRLPVAEDGF